MKKLKEKFRLFERLLGCFILIAILSGSVGSLSLNYIRTLTDNFSNVVYNYGFVQKDISDATMHLNSCNLLLMQSEFDSVSYQQIKSEYLVLEELIHETITDEDSEEAEVFHHLFEHSEEYFAKIEAQNGKFSKSVKDELIAEGNELIEHYGELMDIKQSIGDFEISEIVRINGLIYTIFIGILVAAMVIAIFLGFRMTRKIVRPIKDIRAAAIEIAKGNFDFEIEHKGENEINDLTLTFEHMAKNTKNLIDDIDYQLGEMADNNFCVSSKNEKVYVGDYQSILVALKNIEKKLNMTLNSVGRAVAEVNLAAGQVSSGAQVLSDGATRQASSVEQISASMIDLSNHIDNISNSANEATGLVGTSKDLVVDSNTYMEQLVQAMTDIEDKSSKIGAIAKTIEDIAFQTNILALNAAIEAARAGQAGKGFSVVADEVRSLAAKSAEAAQTTTTLISEAIQAIQSGAEMTEKTAESLNKVVEQASLVGEIVEQISDACSEQSLATKQLTSAIEEVSGVIQTNSATSEESAAASAELSSQAVAVSKMIEQFKLR